jgi:hypothetical protein
MIGEPLKKCGKQIPTVREHFIKCFSVGIVPTAVVEISLSPASLCFLARRAKKHNEAGVLGHLINIMTQ